MRNSKAPIFNRRHYLWLAGFLDQQIGRARHNAVEPLLSASILTQELADMLARENPAFNRAAFLKAAGVTE